MIEIMRFVNKIFEKFFTSTLSKWQIKLFLAMVALSIVVAVVFFTQSLVDELINREQRIINFYAEIYRHYSNPEANFEDYDFFLKEITPTITFPFISTDEFDVPNAPYQEYSLNIQIDTSLSQEKQKEIVQEYVKKMGNSYPPIIIKEADGKVLQKFYYTHSALVDTLRLFPLIGIAIIGAFIIIGYVAFNNIRKSEESKLMVGMAKEAAHQLGTPLSSLLAWLEIIKLNKGKPESIEDLTLEMQNDINRLNTIATRFSKIGSMPEKKIENLSEILEITCLYFERRLPHLGKKVEVVRNFKENILTELNSDLFQWVIENLIKNAAEAIDDKRGKVTIALRTQGKKIIISVTDTGKGMTNKQKRQIFNAGYTTKKRGWGLGLSLCKRIIEEYHGGKIFVKETGIGKGTTFNIELPLIYKFQAS
ncbi:MAG: Histidine kinase protein [Ignavibacteria bacterium]|nr:Histidine kinase protein [Ignavibacteria bacterium]